MVKFSIENAISSKKFTVYKFNTTISLEAKTIIVFSDEMRLDLQARNKSVGDGSVLESCFFQKDSLFLS